MNIPPLHTDIDLSALPLERLVSEKGVPEGKKVAELSRQFEAVFLRQILKDVQKTVIKSEFSDQSMSHDVYQDMVTANLAECLSRAGGLGLAKSLEAELTRQVHKENQK